MLICRYERQSSTNHRNASSKSPLKTEKRLIFISVLRNRDGSDETQTCFPKSSKDGVFRHHTLYPNSFEMFGSHFDALLSWLAKCYKCQASKQLALEI